MLHAKLKEIRESQKLNQTQFGSLVGVNLNTVSAFERGERLPDLEYLIHLSELTNSNLTELIKLRVEASPKFNPLNKSQSNLFITTISRDRFTLGFAEPNEQKNKFYFGKNPKVPDMESDNCLVDADLMLNCHEAVKSTFTTFINMEIPEQIIYIVKLYNNLIKMSEAFGTSISALKALEINGMIKQLEILIALNKMEKIQD